MLWTYKLMIVNAVVFVLHQLLEFWGRVPVADYLALSFGGLAHGYVWQLLTFQFLHGNTLHLLLNLVVIFFFGRAMEEALGARRMLQLYLASGVVGGICQILFQVLMAVVRHPAYLQGGVVGASAGAFGLVAAFATMFPERRITLLVFFVLPVTMSARMMLWIGVALGVVGILIPDDGIAHAAHLGGILAAVLFVRSVVLEQFPLPKIRLARRRRRVPRVRVMKRQGDVTSHGGSGQEEEFSDDFIAREVDPILDKIHARGIHSLTERERRILQAAHSRMQK
jgi:membrane associated rhomboid family serine protease